MISAPTVPEIARKMINKRQQPCKAAFFVLNLWLLQWYLHYDTAAQSYDQMEMHATITMHINIIRR
jgi:hypothetical protein